MYNALNFSTFQLSPKRMQVEMRRFWAAILECQVPTVDVLMLLRTAAHELTWEGLASHATFAGL